ncbi:MAG: hypothetical protein U0930_25480 [Pirellulales bacterium]
MMNKQLKFRRLITESLEQRQLFAADMFFGSDTWAGGTGSRQLSDAGHYGELSHSDSDNRDCDDRLNSSEQSALSADRSAFSKSSEQAVFSFRSSFGSRHGHDRMMGEGEDSRISPPPKSAENLSNSNSVSPTFSSTGSGSGFGAGPNASSLGSNLSSGASTNQLSQTALGSTSLSQAPRSTNEQSIDQGGRIESSNLGVSQNARPAFASGQFGFVLGSQNQNALAKPEPVGNNNSAVTTLVFAIRIGESTTTAPQARFNNLNPSQSNLNQQFGTSPATKLIGTIETSTNAPVQDRNHNSVTVQTIQQQHSSNIRSLQTYLNSSTDSSSLTRNTSQEASSSSLGLKSSTLLDQSITSGLSKETGSDSIVRSSAGASNRNESFEDELLGDSNLSNRLGMINRPWKISENSLNRIKKLSKSNEGLASDSATSNDIAIAGLFEEGGLSEIDYRRNPITRIDQPWNAFQTSVRLESKVGAFRVFDVIDDETPAVIAEVDRSIGLESVAQREGAKAEVIVLNAKTEQVETSAKSAMNKPLFLTTVLAVFSGRLLRSRRKQAANDLSNSRDLAS